MPRGAAFGRRLGCVSKIAKAYFRRPDLHIFVEKPRRSTTMPVFFVSICKPIQHNCIFQTLVTHPRRVTISYVRGTGARTFLPRQAADNNG
jgi:hypothetical protein